MGSNVISIGSSAFYGCKNLNDVTIGSGVTSIDYYTFFNCTNLQTITIGSNVNTINDYAFLNCTSLRTVNIPASVTLIESYAFCNCSNLETVSISTGLSTINPHAFINCTSLKSFDVDSGNDHFKSDGGVLFDHDGKTLIIYPTGIVGDYTIPGTVEFIESYAFSNCTNLTSVTILSSLSDIKPYAFYYCKSLKFLTISTDATATSDNTTIGESAFSGCIDLINITLGSNVVIGTSAFRDCTSLKNVNILPGVTTIGDSAFYNCNKLKTIDLPSTIMSIGSSAFYYCSSLISIVIPPQITRIPSYFCSYCHKLKSVVIPSSVTSIGSYAFAYCHILNSITLPPNLTGIGSSAFMNIDIKSIDIPASVTTIGSGAFYACFNLASVTYHGTINPNTKYYENVFYSCDMLLSVCVPSNYTASVFCKIPVCKTDSCDSIYSQDNQCFGSVCDGDVVTYEMRPGVTSWERTSGCVNYYCNNATGLTTRAACWNKDNGKVLCASGSCVMKASYMAKQYLVAIDIDSDGDMSTAASYFGTDLQSIFGNDYYNYYRNIAFESNEAGELRIWVYSIKYQSDASRLASTLNGIIKDNDCDYHILCNVKRAYVYEGESSSDSNDSSSSSAKPHSTSSSSMKPHSTSSSSSTKPHSTSSSSTKPHSTSTSSDTSTSNPVLGSAVSVHESIFSLFVVLFMMLTELINSVQ